MNDKSLKRNRIENEDDGKDDDDDVDIMIIENPNPKPKPPLIILSETSDDDDDDEHERRDISLNNGLNRPVVIEIGSEPEVDPMLSDNTSQSSCVKTESSNINPLPDYIPLECSPGSSSTTCPSKEPNGLSSPKATCPECRAELFSIKMLHRHIQFRHPNIYQHSTIPELQNTHCQRNVNTSQQRLKLTPLRSPNPTGSVTSGSAIISNASTCTLIRNKHKPSKIVQLPSLVCRRTGGVNQENKGTAAVTTTTISGTSMEMDSINNICQPLKVVIYSPNSKRDRNDRYVQISPLSTDKQKDNSNENKTVDIIEVFDSPCRDPEAVNAVKESTRKNESKKSSCKSGPPPCKRKRQDPLLLLVEEEKDDHEEEISTIPTRKKKKGLKRKRIPVNGALTCTVHRKTFSTQSALLQHYQAKHQNDTKTTKESKPRKSCSLRSNAVPLPSSTPPSMEKLKTMKNIIMIDIDNWQKIFESDLKFSPSTFVWGFHGGSTRWKPPVASSLLKNLKQMNCFYLHPKCGKSKDAADFALCVQAGKLDVLLPKDIIFTVLSGDKGFNELQNQLSLSKREVHIVNPHHKTIDTVLAILNSIADK